MMKDPSLVLTRVRFWHDPTVPLILVGASSVLVVVPTDSEIRFAIEGPDPEKDGAFNQRYISRERAMNASSFLCPFDETPDVKVDLDALVRESEQYRFVWTVARYEQWEGSMSFSHHASLASARRRADQLEATIRDERKRTRTRSAWYADVAIAVHRLED